MPEENHPHPQAHAAAKKRKRMPAWVYEVGLAVSMGWTIYLTTQDWKQGVGAGLIALFGGAVHRGGDYLEKR